MSVTNGRPIFGVNSTALVREIDKNLGRKWARKLGVAYGKGKGQYLTHAEAHSLMRASDKFGGVLPSNMTMYVDRITCSLCATELPNLVQAMGISNLKLIFKDGSAAIIRNGIFTRL